VRVTTASTRDNLRGKGRGRSFATREPLKRNEPVGEGGSSIGRGRWKRKVVAQPRPT
jgi:hypothetical protein